MGDRGLRHSADRRRGCAHLSHTYHRADGIHLARFGRRRGFRVFAGAAAKGPGGTDADVSEVHRRHGRDPRSGRGEHARCDAGFALCSRSRAGRHGTISQTGRPGHHHLYLWHHGQAEGRKADAWQHRFQYLRGHLCLRIFTGGRIRIVPATLAHHRPSCGLHHVRLRHRHFLLSNLRRVEPCALPGEASQSGERSPGLREDPPGGGAPGRLRHSTHDL